MAVSYHHSFSSSLAATEKSVATSQTSPPPAAFSTLRAFGSLLNYTSSPAMDFVALPFLEPRGTASPPTQTPGFSEPTCQHGEMGDGHCYPCLQEATASLTGRGLVSSDLEDFPPRSSSLSSEQMTSLDSPSDVSLNSSSSKKSVRFVEWVMVVETYSKDEYPERSMLAKSEEDERQPSQSEYLDLSDLVDLSATAELDGL